jgi:ABC-2 type transport system permease protein
MPIHDISYRHWQGQPSDRPPSLVLGMAQLRVVMRRRAVRLLLTASAFVVVGYLALLYVETMPRENLLGFLRGVPMLALNGRTLRAFLLYQRLLHYLLCLAAGAELVALDRRHKALQIYLARPLGVPDYLIGKALPLALLLSLTTWIPALALLGLKTIATVSLNWFREEPWLPFSILGYSGLLIVSLVLVTLTVSSLSTSPRLASGQLVAVLVLMTALGEILSGLTHSDSWRLLSINTDLDQIGHWLFSAPLPHDLSPWGVLVALAALCFGCAWILRRRIRAVDVVGGT